MPISQSSSVICSHSRHHRCSIRMRSHNARPHRIQDTSAAHRGTLLLMLIQYLSHAPPPAPFSRPHNRSRLCPTEAESSWAAANGLHPFDAKSPQAAASQKRTQQSLEWNPNCPCRGGCPCPGHGHGSNVVSDASKRSEDTKEGVGTLARESKHATSRAAASLEEEDAAEKRWAGLIHVVGLLLSLYQLTLSLCPLLSSMAVVATVDCGCGSAGSVNSSAASSARSSLTSSRSRCVPVRLYRFFFLCLWCACMHACAP